MVYTELCLREHKCQHDLKQHSRKLQEEISKLKISILHLKTC